MGQTAYVYWLDYVCFVCFLHRKYLLHRLKLYPSTWLLRLSNSRGLPFVHNQKRTMETLPLIRLTRSIFLFAILLNWKIQLLLINQWPCCFYNYFSVRYANYSIASMCVYKCCMMPCCKWLCYVYRGKDGNSSLLFTMKSHPLVHLHDITFFGNIFSNAVARLGYLSMAQRIKTYNLKLCALWKMLEFWSWMKKGRENYRARY